MTGGGKGKPEPGDEAGEPIAPGSPASLVEDLALGSAEGEAGAKPSSPAAQGSAEASSADLSNEGTEGSGTQPEGHTRRQAPSEERDPSSSKDPLIGQTLFDRYKVLRRIGAGGMGSVYVGLQLVVGREVALKVLRPELLTNEYIRQRFRREAEIIGRLTHPNTIQLIDYGETEQGMAVMVMELLRGQPLNERLRDGGPMDLIDVLQLGEEVARSLAEAHNQGLVHRDLKPANIFLVDMGDRSIAKVLDFGIARLLDEEATRLTSTGQVFGTPRYMSPEQALSTAEVDNRSDIYSLGLILYEGLVGQPPFVAQTSLQYLSAHTSQPPPKLRERFPAAPAALEALIDACLEKDPAERPQTAEALADALVDIRRDAEGTPAPSKSPEDRPVWTDPPTVRGTRDAAAWAQGPRTLKPGTPEKPEGPHLRAGLLAGVGSAALLVAVAALSITGTGPFCGTPEVITVVSPDAEPVLGLASGEPDAGTALDARDGIDPPALVQDIADAGLEEDASPTLALSKEDAGEAPKPRPRPRPRRPRPKKQTPEVAGERATTGPRQMVIPGLGAIEPPSLTELARDCRASDWRGRARLTTVGCPRGCAILVDEICAGQTPAAGRALTKGRHEVAIVCADKVVARVRERFRSNETVRVACE